MVFFFWSSVIYTTETLHSIWLKIVSSKQCFDFYRSTSYRLPLDEVWCVKRPDNIDDGDSCPLMDEQFSRRFIKNSLFAHLSRKDRPNIKYMAEIFYEQAFFKSANNRNTLLKSFIWEYLHSHFIWNEGNQQHALRMNESEVL